MCGLTTTLRVVLWAEYAGYRTAGARQPFGRTEARIRDPAGHRVFAQLRLGPGTLYGAINRLEHDGAIAPVTSADRRKPYQLTPTGRLLLASRLELLQRLVTRAAAT